MAARPKNKNAGAGKKLASRAKARPAKRRVKRSTADRVLAPGTAAYPSRPFGSKDALSWEHGLNALSPVHLPLPRAVGEYTVARIASTVTTNQQWVLVGSFSHIQVTDTATSGIKRWLNTGILHAGGVGTEAFSNKDWTTAPFSGLSNFGVSVVPAAITVQIMSTEPISSAQGLVRVSRMKQAIDFGSTRSTSVYFNDTFAVNPPRLLSAGKLALRGVQCSCVPSDMTSLSDFRQVISDAVFSPEELGLNGASDGFFPIMIDNATGQNLSYVVTIEYRVRFDTSNLASAGHTYHKPAPHSVWDKAISCMHGLGHGVVDIADEVASTGNSIASAIRAGSAVRAAAAAL